MVPRGMGWVGGGPARGVGADLGQDLVAQVSPQMPAVTDLDCVGQARRTASA